MPRTPQEVARIIARLESGVRTIKAGHRVKELNPEGDQVTVPLSPVERSRRRENLRQAVEEGVADENDPRIKKILEE